MHQLCAYIVINLQGVVLHLSFSVTMGAALMRHSRVIVTTTVVTAVMKMVAVLVRHILRVLIMKIDRNHDLFTLSLSILLPSKFKHRPCCRTLSYWICYPSSVGHPLLHCHYLCKLSQTKVWNFQSPDKHWFSFNPIPTITCTWGPKTVTRSWKTVPLPELPWPGAPSSLSQPYCLHPHTIPKWSDLSYPNSTCLPCTARILTTTTLPLSTSTGALYYTTSPAVLPYSTSPLSRLNNKAQHFVWVLSRIALD